MDEVRHEVFLACDPERAFRLVTEHAGAWWPLDRRHTRDPTSRIAMSAGGRFWEAAHDGHEVELGRVVGWEPGRRVRLEFFVGTSAEAPTDVTIDFVAVGDGTRVTVVHRPGRAGELWHQRAPRFAQSWERVLGSLAAEVIANP